MISCLPFSNYIQYTYETENQFKFIDNNINISVNIYPQSNKYGNLKQVASGPY